MSRRRQVIKLEGNSTSKLENNIAPSLVGDYTDSDSDEGEDTQVAASIENANSPASSVTDVQETNEDPKQETTPPKEAIPSSTEAIPPSIEAAQPQNDEGTAGAIDDELKNFLSEIEAIPMPDEGLEDSTPVVSEKTWQLKAFQEVNEKKDVIKELAQEEKKDKKPATKKSKMYSMFVKGEPEFVNSPDREEVKTDKARSEDMLAAKQENKIEDLEDVLPDEPTTNWNMVQDETTHYYYYWNLVTNEVTWEIPTEYTQYLLLHREYEERIAKYSAEQLKIYKEKKLRKSGASNGRDTPEITKSSASLAFGPDVLLDAVSNKTHQKDTALRNSEHAAGKDSPEYRRHRREKKKKSHKTKKHKHKRDGSSGDEGRERSPVLIGPAPPPQENSPDSPKTVPNLLSLVSYGSDPEDEDSKVPEKSDSMPVLGPEPDSRLTPNASPKSEREMDVTMPVLGLSAQLLDNEVKLDNEKQSPMSSPKHEKINDSPPRLNSEDSIKEASSCQLEPDNTTEQIPSLPNESLSTEQNLSDSLPKENSIPLSDRDELVSHKRVEEETDRVVKEGDRDTEELNVIDSSQNCNIKTESNEIIEPSNISENVQSKVLAKKKEVIDMFEEYFQLEKSPKKLHKEELSCENKKSVSKEETEPMEEGEISDESSCVKRKKDKKTVVEIPGASSRQPSKTKSHDKEQGESLLTDDTKSQGEKISLKAINILAAYGTDEEEGELKSDTENKKKTETKSEQRKKKTSNTVRKQSSEVHEDKSKSRKHSSDLHEEKKPRKHASEVKEDKSKVRKHEVQEDKGKIRKHGSEIHDEKRDVKKYSSEAIEEKNRAKKRKHATDPPEEKKRDRKHTSELQKEKIKEDKHATEIQKEKKQGGKHTTELKEEKSKVNKHSTESHEQKKDVKPEKGIEVSEDISLDDFDDIDRALEEALEQKLEQELEKKIEQKKEELNSKDDVISSQDTDKEHCQVDEHPSGVEVANAPKGETEDEENNLKVIVQATADLALSKLEFLDIGTDNLSRLQVLFIELQTRLSDWTAGGLSTKYFQQQLEVANGLLEQYELSAVPKGWACQWDRDHNRYYYRHKETGHIQWEYPEVEDEPEAEVKPKESKRKTDDRQRDTSTVEDRKSRSSSSRHKKREDKERSKHDKRSSSHRHRRSKRKRRRDHSSSSSDASEEVSKSKTSKYQHKSSKRKKRSRSKARSPSVEIVEGLEEEIEIREISESPPPGTKTTSLRTQLDMATPDSVQDTPLPSLPPSPEPIKEENRAEEDISEVTQNVTSIEEIKEPAASLDENIDGVEMEQQSGDMLEEQHKEEVNSAVISRPPQITLPPAQISLPPHITSMPPELYAAPSIAAPELIPTPQTDQPETETSQESDKNVKKKKKDKKSLSASSSIGMKKKHMNSMVQKWQKVKKEVEKEEKAKEIRQAAIRQKIEELKVPKT